jgi:glycine cleavage system H protein
MAKIPENLRYTNDHEWAEARGDVVRIGITDFAQESLGDVVMVELPKVGERVTAGKAFGSVESPKSVSDLFAPISGTVAAINDALDMNPEKVNEDAYGDGWILDITPDDAAAFDTLMDAAAYAAHLDALDH